MTIPGNMSLVTVQGRFILLDGTPMSGTVSFAPSPSVILNLNAEVIISGSVFTAPLDATGFFSIDIPATDDPDLNPTNFTYRVQEPTGRTYSISVPTAAPGGVIDLIDVQQVPGAPGQTSILLRGVGIESMEVVAGDLLVHYDDGTSQNLGEVPTGPEGPQGIQGPQGQQGVQGVPGPAGLIWRGAWSSATAYASRDAVFYNGSSYVALNAVSTGGSNPSVDTTNWQLLAQKGDQGIQGPEGDPGPEGPQGDPGPAGLVWRGTWSSGSSYVQRDAVFYNGSSYVAVAAVGTGGSNPSVDTANWQLLAQKGDQGPQGIQGDQGPQGEKGDPGAGSVNSVNGDFGPDIVLDAADVGAAPAGHTHSYLPLTGGTLSGALTAPDVTVSNVPTAAGHATRKDYVDGEVATRAASVHSHPQSDITGLATSLDAKADDAAVVHDTGDETIAGVKTFSATPVSSEAAPTLAGQLTRKDYVDGEVATRAPSTHTHAQADITGLVTALGAKADDSAVVHDTGDETVAGVKTFSSTPATTVTAPTLASHLTRKDYVDGQVATRAASSHTHGMTDVTGLSAALEGKADDVHSHVVGDVSGLQDALDAKQATSARNAANGYAGLDSSSKLTGSQIPYGSTANTAVQGNDARVTADQAAGTASIRTLGTGAQQAAAGNDSRITGAQQTSEKGQANGYAGLGATSKVPIAQLPTGADASSVAIGNDSRFVPAGGATGQVLRKLSGTDFATEWADETGGGGTALGGILDCSAMTLASQINTATATAPFGTQVWLGPHGVGNEIQLDTTLILRPGLHYRGLGGLERLTRLKATAGFTAGQPLVAAQGFVNSASVCDAPMSLIGVDIDGISKVGSHGVVVYNFNALIQNVQVHNIAGTGTVDSAAAFLLTDRGADGSTLTTNSHSENRFYGIRTEGLSAGASNFVQQSFQDPAVTGGSNMDGHLVGAFFAGGTGSGRGVSMQRAAGWTLRDLHLYNCGDDGIRILNCYATDLDGVYIEGYGLNDTASANYNGVRVEQLNGRGSTLSNVKVSSTQPDNPNASRFSNFYILAGTSQTKAMVSLVGCHSNLSRGTVSPTPKTQAWRFGESGHSGRMLYLTLAGRVTDPLPGGFASPARFIHATTVSLAEPLDTMTRVETFAASMSLDPGAPGGRVDITATADITSLGLATANTYNHQGIEVSVLASGATRNITVASAVRTSTGLNRGPYAVPTGEVLTLLFRYSTLISAWTLVAATTSAS